MNCKTIPGEALVSQQRLVVMDLKTIPKKETRYRQENKVWIKWWKLKDQAVAYDYATGVINTGKMMKSMTGQPFVIQRNRWAAVTVWSRGAASLRKKEHLGGGAQHFRNGQNKYNF